MRRWKAVTDVLCDGHGFSAAGMVMRTVPEQVSQTLAAQSALLLLSYVVSSKSLNLSVPVAGRFAVR